MPQLRFPLALSFLCYGCLFSNVVELDPAAKSVRVIREGDRPFDCDYLGKIHGTSRAATDKEALKGAENDLRNRAAELKANFALIETQRTGRAGTSSSRDAFLGGKALYCRTPEMQEAEEKRQEQARLEEEERLAKEQAERERKEQEEKDKLAKEKAEKKAAKKK
jgi:fused signal recognition particle receptor